MNKNTVIAWMALAFLQTVGASEIDISIPESQWLRQDQAMAIQAIGDADFDLLVLPVQAGENSFDPVGRSLITRIVVDRLITGADLRIPNPTYVFRALGSNRSTYVPQDIKRVVESLAPKQILELHANHDRSGSFNLVISLLDGPSMLTQRTKTWSGLKFSDARPPSIVVTEILDEVVEFVTNSAARDIAKAAATPLPELRFTESLEEMVAESAKSPLHSAAYLQLIGMLHPRGDFDEARFGLFERSLIQLGRLPDDYPGKRYFTARAYANLGRRPAAIAALGDPKTIHERALLALLNGDLPALRQSVEKMATSPLDFMAWRELAWLESVYDDEVERSTIDEFVEHAPVWAPFLDRALRDSSNRPEFSAAMVKIGLEQLLPNDVTTIQIVAALARVTGRNPDELELTRLVWRHLDAVDAKEVASRIGKSENYLDLSELDIIDLAKAVVVANQIVRVEFDLAIRRLPDSALRKIADFDTLLAGHPAVTLQKARALDELASDANGTELQSLRSQSAIEYLNGLAWTGQMTKDAARAARRYDQSIRHLHLGKYSVAGIPIATAPVDPIRFFEWPMSEAWYYELRSHQLTENILEHCIAYTLTWFSCLKARVEQLDEDSTTSTLASKQLIADQAHRFIGSPQRQRFEVEIARRGGLRNEELGILRTQVAAGSSDWTVYYSLGRELKRVGDYAAAQEVILSYPGFASTTPADAIALSQYADEAGSMFYWIGQYEQALPLLGIAASSSTGSEGSLISGSRLSLISGDIEAAKSWTAARVRRYNSDNATRDLQQILHILGETDSAWEIFNDAMQSSRQRVAQWWSGALVGHRVASASTDDIANWIEASELRKSAFVRLGSDQGNVKLAPRYLLLAGTMDRQPGPELAKAMAKFRFDRPTKYVRSDIWPRSGPEGTMVVPGFVQEDGKALGFDELIATPPGLTDKKRDEPVEPRYEKIARAMSALLRNNFEEAFEIFNDGARLYYLDEYLSYYALSASIIGNAGHLRAALEAREPELEKIRREEGNGQNQPGYRFDEDLTYAVLAAFEGKHDESIHYLQQAMNNQPYMDNRSVYPYYQVVDLADRLYEHTGKPVYRDYALDLARRHTIILPMYSWAYFVVAKYSESEAEQIDAIASGLKLDPRSYRATQFPESLVENARLRLQKYGPPYLLRVKGRPELET